MSSETEICPFQVDMPDEAIADLRRRVAATCRGGHFAAWEEPELFAAEMRACFRSLR
jgi:pimeloyl-ACP methyl ester carboxylesterase